MRFVSAALAAFTALASAPAIAQAPEAHTNLWSTSWVLIEWTAETRNLPRMPSLSFDRANSFSGRAACNYFSGSYAVIGSIYVLKSPGWTKMLCDQERMELDAKFGADLVRVSRLGVGADGNLVARDGGGAMIFRFRRAAPGEKE